MAKFKLAIDFDTPARSLVSTSVFGKKEVAISALARQGQCVLHLLGDQYCGDLSQCFGVSGPNIFWDLSLRGYDKDSAPLRGRVLHLCVGAFW